MSDNPNVDKDAATADVKKDVDPQPRCSFCGKPKAKVNFMIAAPKVYICNECLDRSNEIMHDQKQGWPWFKIANHDTLTFLLGRVEEAQKELDELTNQMRGALLTINKIDLGDEGVAR